MRTKVTKEAILSAFKRKPLYTLQELLKYFSCSYPCLWTHIHPLDYYSSFTHNGRFCTLARCLDFDANGICYIQHPSEDLVGFTKYRNAKSLIIFLVDSSENGLFEREIRALLNIRVSNHLNVLSKAGKINKIKTDGRYCYYSGNAERFTLQFNSTRTDKNTLDKKSDQDQVSGNTEAGDEPANLYIKERDEYKIKWKKTVESRNKWRDRSNKYRYTIKLMSLRIRDLITSRDLWKQHATEYKQQNIKLELELKDNKKNSRAN